MPTPRHRLAIFSAVTLCLAVAGCQKPTSAVDKPKPVTSIKEIMLSMVDPSADRLWASVSYTSNLQGVKDRAPKTDKEWASLRAAALTLAEASNLLAMPGRAVAPDGDNIQDSKKLNGIDAAVVRKNLERDWPQFVTRAHALQVAALDAVAAVDARDPRAIEVIGGRIDEACEACHSHFWYPPKAY